MSSMRAAFSTKSTSSSKSSTLCSSLNSFRLVFNFSISGKVSSFLKISIFSASISSSKAVFSTVSALLPSYKSFLKSSTSFVALIFSSKRSPTSFLLVLSISSSKSSSFPSKISSTVVYLTFSRRSPSASTVRTSNSGTALR